MSDKLFQKLVQIFEKVRVRDYGSSRDYQSSTFYHIAYAYYIVYPINENEIKMLLHIATEEQLTLSVISTGKNWGYGSKQPRKSVSIIVDLSLMNQIIYLNPKELYARIQPGVTQLQMVNYLQKHYPNLILDLTGGPLSASIIGNALTHGHGIGMLGNHADAIFNLSVILPNQKRIESGNLRFNTAKKIAHLPGHILGPNFDKLFNQSEYGIVIESSV
ncbi:MAG: FAD-dependent oxidoreductase, partial [Chryseobacterium sp.]